VRQAWRAGVREPDALIEACDVVTVASPAVFHHDAARRALIAGKAVLVEKPLAATAAEARELVSLAELNNAVLRVGHQERFVFDAMGLFGDLPASRRSRPAHGRAGRAQSGRLGDAGPDDPRYRSGARPGRNPA
jgi:predicted dehydrogenase